MIQINSWKIDSIGRNGSTSGIKNITFLWLDKMNSQIRGLTYRNFRNTETIRPVLWKIVMQIDNITAIEASVWAAFVLRYSLNVACCGLCRCG